MSDEYLWNKTGEPDPEVAELEELLGRFRHRGDSEEFDAALDQGLRFRQAQRRMRRFYAAAAVLAAIIGGSLYLRRIEPPLPGYLIESVAGDPQIGGTIRPDGAVVPGEALMCNGGTSAVLRVGDIGRVTLQPGCELAVREAGEVPGSEDADYLLYLSRGGIRAEIFAEPRRFQVGTPAGLAVDLGCVYEAYVAEDGSTELAVTSGLVSFESAQREVVVPEGAVALSHPERGPGTPVWANASESYRTAARALDQGTGDASAHLEVLLATRDERDTLTLWHLLDLEREGDRELVYRRLAELAPPPSGVNRAGVLAGDQAMRKRWRRVFSWYWGKKI